MKKNIESRNGFIHLYDPKKEGIGTYDINYINAYKKIKLIKYSKNKNTQERHAA